jgi:hypothetical protein
MGMCGLACVCVSVYSIQIYLLEGERAREREREREIDRERARICGTILLLGQRVCVYPASQTQPSTDAHSISTKQQSPNHPSSAASSLTMKECRCCCKASLSRLRPNAIFSLERIKATTYGTCHPCLRWLQQHRMRCRQPGHQNPERFVTSSLKPLPPQIGLVFQGRLPTTIQHNGCVSFLWANRTCVCSQIGPNNRGLRSLIFIPSQLFGQ